MVSTIVSWAIDLSSNLRFQMGDCLNSSISIYVNKIFKLGNNKFEPVCK